MMRFSSALRNAPREEQLIGVRSAKAIQNLCMNRTNTLRLRGPTAF
jgi:hypothetical protein